MTTTVRVEFIDIVAQTAFETEMAAWLQPYIDAGSTGGFPTTNVSGNTVFRDFDTVENAQAFIDKVLTYTSQVGSATIV